MNYDHFIAIDWAQSNMAIARTTRKNKKVSVIDIPSDIKELKVYLNSLRGTKIITFEECNTSQWLFVELSPYVNKIIVCDPTRNYLLSEGAKTDKIDAIKLVQLLKADFLKPVFHDSHCFIELRKIVSAYRDLSKEIVRIKNQRAALFRGQGRSKDESELNTEVDTFVLYGLDKRLKCAEFERDRYMAEFKEFSIKNYTIKNLMSIPGIGLVGANIIAARVVKAERFPSKSHFLSYCGLVKLDRMSGGRSYGRKSPRYCRDMKYIFKIATQSNLLMKNKSAFYRYYKSMREKGYADHVARHALARRIAVITFGILKTGRRFNDNWNINDNI